MQALFSKAVLARRAGRFADAEAAYREWLALEPDNPAPRYGLSTLLLALGRYAEAWPLYESRRQVLPRAAIPPISHPVEWRGDDPRGRRIAVVAEQGLGDQIMFGRYLTELAARGAEVVIALGMGNLKTLFEHLGFETTGIYGHGELRGVDGWTYFGSLPFRLGMAAPPPAEFLELPTTTGGGVGVIATGNPMHPNDANRSLPPPLADRLRSLGRDLSPSATGAADFMDTARIVAGLDLVVGVDTSVVHLAGAMGKPCCVLLPREGLDWRWNDGLRSDWYPEFRLLRQTTAGDWSGPMREVLEILAEEMG
jgi:hypothetical protein